MPASDPHFTAPHDEPTEFSPLSEISLSLDNETAQALGEAERAIWQFGQLSNAKDKLRAKAFSDMNLHVESLANIKMTGKQVNARDVFRAAVMKPTVLNSKGVEGKQESLRNIDALMAARAMGDAPLTVDSLYSIHRHLLEGTTRETFQGALRSERKQTGGGRYQPFGSRHLAPDPQLIPALLEDLVTFCNQTSMPAVAQSAIAHVRFLAIHPFERANGKTARVLIQLVLQRRQLITQSIPPLSLVLSTSPHDYQRGVIATMDNLRASDPDPTELNAWLRFFAQCCTQAVGEANALQSRMEELQDHWHAQIGARADSASMLLVNALPGIPVFTVNTAADYLGRSFKRVTLAVEELAEAGVIRQITEGRRNRVFECPDIVDAYARIKGFQ